MYDKLKLETDSLKFITENDLLFLEDVIAYLPCSRATFYNLKLDKLDTIKDALSSNRIKTKSYLRKQWLNSGNATTQIALYKLLANSQESDALNGRAKEKSSEMLINLPVGAELEIERE